VERARQIYRRMTFADLWLFVEALRIAIFRRVHD